jgi:hypothetical protein
MSPDGEGTILLPRFVPLLLGSECDDIIRANATTLDHFAPSCLSICFLVEAGVLPKGESDRVMVHSECSVSAFPIDEEEDGQPAVFDVVVNAIAGPHRQSS